jgi:hypothetical protein
MIRKTVFLLLITAVASVTIPTGASALKYNQSPPWMINVGMGTGTGKFDDIDETRRKHRWGAVPQIRFGRMIGKHLQLSTNYHGWIVEFDRYGDAVLEDAKIRRSLQDLTLGLAWFPAGPDGFWRGFHIRAGVGLGWAGNTIVPVVEGGKQEHGERHDDWGTAYFAEVGYDIWISGNSALGLTASHNYFDLDGDIVQKAWVTSANITLSLYF